MGNVSAYILSQHMVLLKSLSLGTFGAVRQGDRLYPEHPGGDSPAPPNLQLILYPKLPPARAPSPAAPKEVPGP